LGYLQDNIFGSTTAGIYTQLVPSGNNVTFGDYPTLDSIVLTLRYTGNFYGDTMSTFAIRVYELSETMDVATTYKQSSSVGHSLENLTYQSDFRITPKPNTKVKVDTLIEAHIRIRLSDKLGNSFLESTAQMKTQEDFKKFFKGLYICAEPVFFCISMTNDGTLVIIDLTNSLSGIQLFYKNDDSPKKYYFPVNDKNTVRFNAFTHDYENGDPFFLNQVLHGDTLLGEKILYVQASGGVKTKITFPNIKTLKDKKIVINKAELVITNIEDDLILSNYPTPSRLSLYGVNPKGDNVRLPDDAIFTNSAYWGGNYNATEKEYRFRITRFIQDIILHDSFESFIYLVPEGAAASVNRLVFSGTNPENEKTRLRLEVYYTEY
jgi:hypothetical protein